MYTPRAFAVEDLDTLRDLMRHDSFATLVSTAGGAPVATHLPLLLDERGAYGTLAGHLARANPQWHAFDGRTEALVIFQGPHGYVSPAWYETQPAVPTWNYMVAHVYGTPRVVEDEDAVMRHLRALVARFEGGRECPSAYPYEDDWLRRMQRGVVAFELPVARIEGKFKLSQNRSEIDRARVAAEFSASDDSDARAMAATMRALGIAPAG